MKRRSGSPPSTRTDLSTTTRAPTGAEGVIPVSNLNIDIDGVTYGESAGEIDLDPIREAAQSALDSGSMKAIDVDLTPSVAEPDVFDSAYIDRVIESGDPDALRELNEAQKAQRQSPRASERESDAEIGRRVRAHYEQQLAEEVKDELIEALHRDWNRPDSPLLEHFEEDDNWGQRINEKAVERIGQLLDAPGVDVAEVEWIVGPEVVEAVREYRQQQAKGELVEAMTVAYLASEEEHARLAPLGENHLVADRAAAIRDELTQPFTDPQTGAVYEPQINMVGATKADGRALALASYELAAWEHNEAEAAEQRLAHAIAENGNGRGDAAWYFNVFLPDLAQTNPAEYERQLAYVLPRPLDDAVVTRILQPLRVPLKDAMEAGDQRVIRAHGQAIGEDIVEQAKAILPGIELDNRGAYTEQIAKAVADENRQLEGGRRKTGLTEKEHDDMWAKVRAGADRSYAKDRARRARGGS
jgi:hypothetical protein